jgi:hypothetical protein
LQKGGAREGAQRWGRVLLGGAPLLGLLLGCISAQPRFPPDVQRAINREDMRRLETSDLVVYYPDGTRAEALAVAARLEYCRRELARVALAKNRFATDKPVFVLPRLPLNNAYLQPTLAGNEQVSVVPQYNTANLFIAYGIPPDPGTIGCHEMVHDQSYRQVTGIAAGLRTLFGDIYSPQLGLDSWWQEGLAVYYETKLQGVGRLWTKYTDGIFAAGMQEVSTLHGGYLSPEKREVFTGGPYLIGARFVDYLARRYGERRLWQVIDGQSNAFAFPFAISNEFRAVYGKPLATLLEDFEADTRRRYRRRDRAEEQHTLLRLGRSSSLARAPNGREIIASEDLDEPPRLIVRDADGKQLSSHRLTDIGIGRRLLAPRVSAISGLSLTADGAHAYFVVLDSGPVFTEARLVHLDVDADTLEVIAADLGGAGGSISPDGRYYYFNRPTGKSLQLAFALFRLELASARVDQLTTPEPRHYHADPVVSPDGRRLLVTEASDAGIRLAIYAAADGQRLGDVAAPPGMAFDGSWVDADRVVFAGTTPERMQIFETDLRDQKLRQLTDAPYLAVSPFSNGLTLRFLNRDGWNWTLDEVYHPSSFAPTTRLAASRAGTAPAASAIEPAQPRTSASRHQSVPGSPAPAARVRGAANPAQMGNSAFGTSSTLGETLRGLRVSPTSFAYSRRRAIADREPDELSDEPYSGFDGLFPPNVWGPRISFDADGDAAYGLQVMGGDRLGWQRWALGAGWSPDADLPSAQLSYLNGRLAPVSVRLDVAYSGRREDVFDFSSADEAPVVFIEGTTTSVRLEEITGRLTLGARLYDSVELELGGRYASVRYELGGDLRFAGPLARIGFDSAERTPYTGLRLAVGAEATGTYFPQALSTVPYDLIDSGARARLVLPLPLSRRHTLTLAGRWRGLLGAPEGQDLLQVGGGGTDLLSGSRDESPLDDARAGALPPGVRFFETLRGFEDRAQFGRRALIGDATYTYPFIIDWGTASTLKFLPSLFVRQINLDLFFTAASFLEEDREEAFATGASLELETSFWLLPLSFELQGTRRLRPDEDYAVYFVIGGGER